MSTENLQIFQQHAGLSQQSLPDFKSLFEAMPVPCLVLSPNFTIVAVNDAYLRETKRLRDTIVGLNIFDAFPDNPLDPDANGVQNLRTSLERVLRSRAVDVMMIQKYDIPGQKPGDFEERNWSPVNSPVFNSAGELTHIIHRVENVTEYVKQKSRAAELEAEILIRTKEALATRLELKLSREELERVIAEQTATLSHSDTLFRQLANAMPHMAFIADRNGNIFYVNAQTHEFLSKDITLLGWGWTEEELIHPDDLPRTIVVWTESIKTGKTYEIEYRMKRHDGVYRWHLGRAVALRDKNGEIYQWYGTNTDIHEQKVLQEELQKAKNEADTANHLKSAFLANMSHEIRTPLGAILGFAELMQDKSISDSDKEAFLDTILRNGNSLTRIIDDILDLSKVESGKIEVENIEFSLTELMNDVMDLFREKARAKGLDLRLNIADQVPSRICSDPTRLRQIFTNVIGNAVKFTHEGSVSVHVKSSLHKDTNLCFTVTVRDTGIGISTEESEKLFQPFAQANRTTTRKYGGTGLGLALSLRLAKALGGDISILNRDPDEGSGATLLVTFPTKVPKSLQAKADSVSIPSPAPGPQTLPLSGIRVLVADDSLDNQFVAQRILTRLGALVEVANNGLEATRMALRSNYDIVLMDVQMPEMDGIEATKFLRKAGFKKAIIALTAQAMADDKERTQAAGYSGHLTKPLIQPLLVQTIQQHV